MSFIFLLVSSIIILSLSENDTKKIIFKKVYKHN